MTAREVGPTHGRGASGEIDRALGLFLQETGRAGFRLAVAGAPIGEELVITAK